MGRQIDGPRSGVRTAVRLCSWCHCTGLLVGIGSAMRRMRLASERVRVMGWPNRPEGDVVRAVLPRDAPNALVVLSIAARGDALWVLICAMLAIRAGVSRRAAVRGVTALGAASAVSHVLGRVLPFRSRPRAHDVPARRSLPEHPRSSSFPSAHATSAAAVTAALTLESGPLGAMVAPLAVLVTYSRILTRVHWPTDVAAGATLGILVALMTRRLPPLESVASRHPEICR